MGDNRLGKYDTTLSKTARQAVPDPTPPREGNKDATSVLSGRGEHDLLGETIAEETGQQDGGRPALPGGGLDGLSDLNLKAVGPYKYPEFGSWPNPERGFTIAGTDIID